MTIDFDFSTVASRLWMESFDFWLTSSDHPTYKGRHMTLMIGGRTYAQARP
jgi:hypothetical protein